MNAEQEASHINLKWKVTNRGLKILFKIDLRIFFIINFSKLLNWSQK